MRIVPFALALVVGAAGCGGGYSGSGPVTAQSTGGGTPVAGAYVITISGMSFSPLDLHVPPGATVTVENKDGIDHSVTSEATSGSYTPGAPSGLAPFDTGIFATGQKTFTVPSNAAAGTVMPYYCAVHRQTMATPNGTITIDPGAKGTTSTTSGSSTTSAPAGGY